MAEILKVIRRAFPESSDARMDAAISLSGINPSNLIFTPHLSSRKVARHPDGHYSFWVSEEAEVTVERDMGFSLTEIEPLAKRVFETVRKLGFWRGVPIHFVLNVNETKRETNWVVCKIEPPMKFEPDLSVERSILVFLPTLRREASEFREACVVALAGGQVDSGKIRMTPGFERLVNSSNRAKHLMHLTHEMVHIVATDEYLPIMEVLGLSSLELLTDAINVVTFYQDYKSADPWRKAGFANGAAYIVNELTRESEVPIHPSQIVELTYKRAREIIRECQEKLKLEITI